MCSLKNMDKVVETDAQEEVTNEGKTFKAALFCYGKMNLDMDNYLNI